MNIAKRGPYNPLTSLHRLEFILQHQSDQLLRSKLRVGFGQVRIMEEIPGDLSRSQREIALRLHQSQANISRQLRELKTRGLVKISANKKDRRQRDVSLTDKGKIKYDQARKLLNKHYSKLLGLLGKDELKTFEHSIHNLLASLGIPISSR